MNGEVGHAVREVMYDVFNTKKFERKAPKKSENLFEEEEKKEKKEERKTLTARPRDVMKSAFEALTHDIRVDERRAANELLYHSR